MDFSHKIASLKVVSTPNSFHCSKDDDMAVVLSQSFKRGKFAWLYETDDIFLRVFKSLSLHHRKTPDACYNHYKR